MSLKRADLRFALPRPVRTAGVVGDLEGWAEGFRLAGVEVIDAGGGRTPTSPSRTLGSRAAPSPPGRSR